MCLWLTYLPSLFWPLRPADPQAGRDQGKDLGLSRLCHQFTLSLGESLSGGAQILVPEVGHDSFGISVWVRVTVIRLHSADIRLRLVT